MQVAARLPIPAHCAANSRPTPELSPQAAHCLVLPRRREPKSALPEEPLHNSLLTRIICSNSPNARETNAPQDRRTLFIDVLVAAHAEQADGRFRYNRGMRDDETRRVMALPPSDSPASSRARRLLRSRVGRALLPHWGALLALTLFLIVGLAILDDYGVTDDELSQLQVTPATLGYIVNGDLDAFIVALWHSHGRFYGMASEAPVFLADRAFGLEDGRPTYLIRHLFIHLFFLGGGLFAYLLAYRLFGARLLAVAALLLLLLHPRLYAHSFFNSKDIPFLAMFVAALFLAHRAFKRDRPLAFALLGVGVGVLLNLRIMGVVLPAGILSLRALDLIFARTGTERKRILLETGAFALASFLTIYALLPYLWADPIGRAVEWWTTLSDHPYKPYGLFRGLLGRSVDFPEYVTVWFSITTPPFALLLGLIGGAGILFSAIKAPREALRNTRLRFGLLLAGCFALPILAVALLNPNLYFGWRHVQFLWAPFALLAAWGLHGLVGTLRLQRLRAAVYGAAGAGLAATLISMALIHPNQQVFFNFSVDRVTPEYLRTQYVMDYWRHPMLQALRWLSDNADLIPDKAAITGTFNWEDYKNATFLPDAARARIAGNTGFTIVPPVTRESWTRSARTLHRVVVYDNTIFTVERKDDLQAVYDATTGREPDVAAAFDVHQLDGAVALVMEPCAPAFIEQMGATLRVTPVDPGDLPSWREGKREEPRSFGFSDYGAFFDGKCVASLPLPDYPIADFKLVWGAELLDREAARETMRHAKEEGQLLARSAYDVYLADGELVYVQEPCDPIDTEPPFRVSVFSNRAEDSSERRRKWDRETHDFEFHQRGALLEDGACVALFPLPNYSVTGIETGQRTRDGSSAWSAAFSANPERYATAYRAVAKSEPVAEGPFDLHLFDGDLVYVKEPCAQADTEARFFLHIVPERVNDLPEERRELGWDNLDFRFFLNGAWFDEKCAAQVALPSYPIASVRTGQFVSGTGEIWSANFEIGRVRTAPRGRR